MTWDHNESGQSPSKLRLLEEYTNVESVIDSIPTLAQIEEIGAYSADEFRAAFGSHDALVQAAQRPKNQVLLAIRRERTKRGHTPKLSEVRESEREYISDLWEHFETWTEALEAAEVLPTNNEIIEAIQREKDPDQVPNADDFLDQTEYRRTDYLYHFESWDDALLAAGFGIDEDELYSEIHRVTDEIGQTPTLAEFKKAAPSAYAMYQRSDHLWMEALDNAGVLPSKDDIIRKIKNVSGRMDGLPNAGEFTDRTDIRGAVYQHYFGDWTTALGEAELLPSKNELTAHIQSLSGELEPIPSQSNFLKKSKYSKSVYDYHFDSWGAAILAAGLLPSKEELVSQIQTVSEATDTIPNQDAVVEKGDYRVQAYEFHFSSWEEALDAADVLPSQAEFLSLVRSAATRSEWVNQNVVYKKDGLPNEYHTNFFDSWEATLDAADVLPAKEEFLSMVRDTEANNGWINQQRFYAETDLPNEYHKRFFNSWGKALDAAEILPTKEELLQHLRELGTELGPVPSHSEAIKEGTYQGTVYRFRFGSWSEALDAAGLLPAKQELIKKLRILKKDMDRIPSKYDIPESGNYQLDIYLLRFGSWENALEAAGIIDKESFIVEVKRVAAEQGPIVTPANVYDEWGFSEDYHKRFYDSWEEVLETLGAFDGELPAPIKERLHELNDEWGRPPSEEYARRHLDINTRATLHGDQRISIDWEAALEATGLNSDEVNSDADFIKEIEQLADILEHRPSRTEVEKYLLEESNYTVDRWEINGAIEQATVPVERDLTPTRSLTRQRCERDNVDIPSHTDLLVELNIIRSRTKSDKDAIQSEFKNRGVIDERHYSIQFGSVAAAVDELLAIDTRQFSAPIKRNFSLTPGMLRETVRELGEILERPPLLEEVVFLGEASTADFAETFNSWADVTNTDPIVRNWSSEELLNNVKEVGRKLGKPPNHEELLEFGTVPVQCLLRRFGIWPRVLWLVGVDVDAIPQDYLAYEFTSELWNTTDYLVREEFGHGHALFDELQRLSFEFDCVPSGELVQRYSPYALETFTREFGSITSATDRAEITSSDAGRPPTPSPEDLLRDLQTISETETTWVLPQDISLHTEHSVGTYIGVFKSLENALEQANLPTDHLVGPTETYSDTWHAEHQMKAGVLRAITDLASRNDDKVTMARLQSIAGISQNVVYRFFDDWDEAREAARVRESLGTVEVDPNEIKNPDFVDDLLSEMDEMMEEY